MAETLLDEDTIVAVSTPPGRGGIGIVRLSGAMAREIAERLVAPKRPMAAGRARFGMLMDRASGDALDEAVVTYFAAPHSYTTEDVVEIAVHGSPALLEYVLRECCAGGARLAQPGEFTQRAFLNGRLDLTQAEAVDDLIRSQTLEQARVAARQLGGALSRVVMPIKEKLIGLIAALEAGIDFAEDDIDVMPAKEIIASVEEAVTTLETLARSFSYGRVVREGFSLAIVGRPNAGKSSLFNRLVERDRAIVTATPGTTRDLVAETMSLKGIPVELIDTAGLRTSLDEAEELGIAKSREAMADADVVLVVVDSSEGIGVVEKTLVEGLAGRPYLVVWNKSDLAGDRMQPGFEGTATSAVTGEGLAELRRAILRVVTGEAVADSQGMLTNLRQQQSVVSSIAALVRARLAIANNVPHEMVLLDLYESLQALDSLTGATSSDDILHLIFSKFCIGK